METYTTVNTTIHEIDRQLILATSALSNLRAMLAKNGTYVPEKKRNWPKEWRYECDRLRDRVDDLMGTVTLLLSACACNSEVDGVNISKEDANHALMSCTQQVLSDRELSIEAIEEYRDYIAIVTDLVHGSNPVSADRAVAYYRKSLEISSMLVSL